MDIDIDSLTLGQLKEISKMCGAQQKQSAPVQIGKAYLFRTVTRIEVGRVVSVCGDFIEIEDASWISDTGRYHDCLVSGAFGEVAPYPNGAVLNSSAFLSYAPWDHPLPRQKK